jgi:hypothetical protein
VQLILPSSINDDSGNATTYPEPGVLLVLLLLCNKLHHHHHQLLCYLFFFWTNNGWGKRRQNIWRSWWICWGGGVRYTLYSTVYLFINESPYVCETCVFSNIGETVNWWNNGRNKCGLVYICYCCIPVMSDDENESKMTIKRLVVVVIRRDCRWFIILAKIYFSLKKVNKSIFTNYELNNKQRYIITLLWLWFHTDVY